MATWIWRERQAKLRNYDHVLQMGPRVLVIMALDDNSVATEEVGAYPPRSLGAVTHHSRYEVAWRLDM